MQTTNLITTIATSVSAITLVLYTFFTWKLVKSSKKQIELLKISEKRKAWPFLKVSFHVGVYNMRENEISIKDAAFLIENKGNHSLNVKVVIDYANKQRENKRAIILSNDTYQIPFNGEFENKKFSLIMSIECEDANSGKHIIIYEIPENKFILDFSGPLELREWKVDGETIFPKQ